VTYTSTEEMKTLFSIVEKANKRRAAYNTVITILFAHPGVDTSQQYSICGIKNFYVIQISSHSKYT
jgi:hypothetical protein